MKKVITYGTFDLLHEGHLQILKRAKKLGDYLIVGITSDHYDMQRGKMNVKQSLIQRIENVKQTLFADEIIIEEYEGQKIRDIQKYNISTFVIGNDWQDKFDYLKEYCKVIYLERTPNISSTILRDKSNGIVRLGIVGCGRIAWRAVHEINYVSGIEIVNVYNPNINSANKFAKIYKVPKATDDYNQFLDDVNAVYIASPHETHYKYALSALQNNKHVICEKPMTLNKQEAENLFSIAKTNNLVLMEAIKTAYAPGFSSLLSIAKSGRIGNIQDVEATFTKLIKDENAREYKKPYGGSFTELASYTLLPIIKLLGTNYKNIHFNSFRNKDGIDIYTKCYLSYDSAIATAKVGIGIKSEGQLLISGTKGYILVKSPWWLTKSFEVCYENTSNNEHFSAYFKDFGLRYEFSDFVKNIQNINSIEYKLLPKDSIQIANIIQMFLKST